MNILCKNIAQKYQDAVNYAKSRFDEKTTANAVLKVLLRFQHQESIIENLQDDNAMLRAKAYLLERGMESISDKSSKTLVELENNIKRYRNVTNSLPHGEDQEEE